MGGVTFTGTALEIDRAPNELDSLAIEFTRHLDAHDIQHVYVAGYTAILAGRSRATEDIDVLLAPQSESTISQLVDRLTAADLWGPAMSLEDMYETLETGGRVWIARTDHVIPHLDVTFVADEFDRASLRNAIPARIGHAELPIGPLELAIAYKLHMGAQRDFEDALHLFSLFGETLSTDRLEHWVSALGVQNEYDRLRTA